MRIPSRSSSVIPPPPPSTSQATQAPVTQSPAPPTSQATQAPTSPTAPPSPTAPTTPSLSQAIPSTNPPTTPALSPQQQAERRQAQQSETQRQGTVMLGRVGTLREGMRGPEVQELQTQLNAYRARTQPPPPAIPTNGTFDRQTQQAIRDYQQANQLRPADGQASPGLQTHLQLRNDVNFRSLATATQDNLLHRVVDRRATPELRDGLVSLATAPNFRNLNGAHQSQMIEQRAGISGLSNQPMISEGFRNILAQPNFLQLNDATRSTVIQNLGQYAGSASDMQSIANFATHPNFVRMTPDNQRLALSVHRNAGAEGRQALQEILQERPQILNQPSLGGTPPTTLLQNLDRLGTQTNHYGVLDSTLREISRPDREINQGPSSSMCTVSSMSHILAQRHPSEYARLVTDLAENGRATLAGGQTIQAPPSQAVNNLSSGRSQSETLLQGALYTYGRSLPSGDENAELLALYNPQGQAPGLTGGQEQAVFGQMFNQNAHRFDVGVNQNGFGNQDAVIQRLRTALQEGRPVVAGVAFNATGSNHRSGHMIEILRVEGDRVIYRDPYGADAQRLMGSLNPPNQVHTGSDASTGIRSMRRGDLENNLTRIIY